MSAGQRSVSVSILIAGLWLLGLSACTPRVELAASEPITINLNVKIEHEVRVRVEKDLENLFDEEDDIF
ncbi:YnbE family lipoprotein [Allohahella marinimesophila]|uniref:YnbE family lipoprotein n=1 Tax=Allohahella marinimesophila TaxID=1054972 RepID=A0ABP7PCF2_9GAMM